MLDALYTAKTRKNLKVYAIIATDLNGFIGKDNCIPWRVPSDLKRFKRLTKNHPIIMGRKTYESIGKPLPYRTNLVITSSSHSSEKKVEEPIWCKNTEEALDRCVPNKVVWICGGAEIYKQFMPIVDVVHHTLVDTSIDGDTKFANLPQLAALPGWMEVRRDIFYEDGDQFRTSYAVHARLESILRANGLDING